MLGMACRTVYTLLQVHAKMIAIGSHNLVYPECTGDVLAKLNSSPKCEWAEFADLVSFITPFRSKTKRNPMFWIHLFSFSEMTTIVEKSSVIVEIMNWVDGKIQIVTPRGFRIKYALPKRVDTQEPRFSRQAQIEPPHYANWLVTPSSLDTNLIMSSPSNSHMPACKFWLLSSRASDLIILSVKVAGRRLSVGNKHRRNSRPVNKYLTLCF